MSSYLSETIKSYDSKNKKTLQVCPLDIYHSDGRACLKASLTVEAALVLPLMLFCMILLLMPLHMMNADRKVQKICEDVAGDVSKYMYTINEYNRGNTGNRGYSSGTDQSGKGVQQGAEGSHGGAAGSDNILSMYKDIGDGPSLGAFAAARIKSGIDDGRLKIVNVLNSDIDSRDDMITIRIDYAYKLPFKVFDLGFLQQEAVASRRAWVGASGSTKTEGGTAEDGTEEDEWVYIGKNPTRYHLTSTCHYLYNDWKSAVVGTNGKANGKGPCDICGSGAAPGQTVFITPGGDKFHTGTDCTAMKSYPQMVRRSEVEHLGCCSYCRKHSTQ